MFYAKDAATWRRWLSKNHATKKSVWLVYYKAASGKPRVSYSDAVDEALCFGWIDSKPNKLDEFRSLQYFAPRNPKSRWSKVNKAKIARLVKEKRMSPAGLELVKIAKANGAWDYLNDVEEMIIPDDLLNALKKVPKAHDYFMAFPKSSKKIILEWLHTAKQTVTREKRISETVKLAAKDVRANHYRQPKKK